MWALSRRCPNFPKRWSKGKITLFEHLVYKFILTLEGIDVSTSLKWVMSTNSVAVMPRPTYETWFMEGTLIPNYHYIEIKSDYSDLPQRLQYYIDHPEEAEAIARHAHEYISQFRDKKAGTADLCCWLCRNISAVRGNCHNPVPGGHGYIYPVTAIVCQAFSRRAFFRSVRNFPERRA
ncbi:MAG: glycosyl transferase family 90 [Alistipes indistinctus]